MTKVCILSATNLRHMSMVSIYTSCLEKAGIKYDLIYMDKYGEEEKNGASQIFRFQNIIQPEWSKLKKVVRYMRFRRYAINKMNQGHYDFIIVWNDLAIFMFADYLSRVWKGKYSLNIRDDNHYNSKLLKGWYNRVFRDAAFRTISSDAYREFLPSYEYIMIHSLNETALHDLKPRGSLRDNCMPIRIGFVGYVRFFDLNKRLLDVFKNDPRFELCYFGTHADALMQYAQENGVLNAVFHDTFPVEQTAEYVDRIDIMNNLYGNETANLRTALSIKLYHAIYARIPILVSPDTYMEKVTSELGIGFVAGNINQEMKERLYDWYNQLDFSKLNFVCTEYIQKIADGRKEFEEAFHQFLIR